MKSTGVVRKIDELGRVVLPSEIRKVFAIHEGDELDISVDGERIILQKRIDTCLFCGAESPAISYRDRRVCEDCAAQLGSMRNVELVLPEDSVVTS
ncbi:MAG TPA: AbrB/MazE/SpoVT family DNA-binding domain-containing protein [Actinomycetota bacterium]|nr:AbrB/MazE/SpoVT family DNA-binding domain-containing protein [Actinomycetota bacterium]